MRRRAVWGAVSLLAPTLVVVAPPAPASAAPGVTVTFLPSATPQQTFTVPAGVTSIHVRAVGGTGQNGITSGTLGRGGPGGVVSAHLPVTPGQTLYLWVAHNGADGGEPLGGLGGSTGFARRGGRGGGGSFVLCQPWTNPFLLPDCPLVVAGGGGGGGGTGDTTEVDPRGGNGGGATQNGGDGGSASIFLSRAGGGKGGFGTVVGEGGAGSVVTPGSQPCPAMYHNGGNGGTGSTLGGGAGGSATDGAGSGGGGGGGLFPGGGGGGGAMFPCGGGGVHIGGGGGGGGGSNFVAPSATDVFFGFDATASPRISISYGDAAITSADNALFKVGDPGTFTVTSAGSPGAALSVLGALPTGVTFVDNGDGTGTLSGEPAGGTSGVYLLTVRAANGVGPDATQTFRLTVGRQALIAVVGNSVIWTLKRNLGAGGGTQTPFVYGTKPLVPVMGDWDGNGTKTAGTYERGTFKLSNDNSSTALSLNFGSDPRGFPVAGDFDGDHRDDLAVFNNGTWQVHLMSSPATVMTSTFSFGPPDVWPNVVPVAGDWDGDGVDGVGVYHRASIHAPTGTWILRAGTGAESTTSTFAYDAGGGTSAYPLSGDWNADGTDTVGVRLPGSPAFWHLRNSNSSGSPDLTDRLGTGNDLPLVWASG